MLVITKDKPEEIGNRVYEKVPDFYFTGYSQGTPYFHAQVELVNNNFTAKVGWKILRRDVPAWRELRKFDSFAAYEYLRKLGCVEMVAASLDNSETHFFKLMQFIGMRTSIYNIGAHIVKVAYKTL